MGLKEEDRRRGGRMDVVSLESSKGGRGGVVVVVAVAHISQSLHQGESPRSLALVMSLCCH